MFIQNAFIFKIIVMLVIIIPIIQFSKSYCAILKDITHLITYVITCRYKLYINIIKADSLYIPRRAHHPPLKQSIRYLYYTKFNFVYLCLRQIYHLILYALIIMKYSNDGLIVKSIP